MRSVMMLSSCATVLLSSLQVPAQIIVDPGGGGHYTDLQPAITAAPAGATIVVRGGSYAPITVDKSLMILGNPRFEIYLNVLTVPCTGPGVFCQGAAIALNGGPGDRFVLANALVRGRANGFFYNEAGWAIRSNGFEEIWVEDCDIRAPLWDSLTGVAGGSSAIWLETVGKLFVVRSFVVGNESGTDSCYNTFFPDGGIGIDAPGSSVTLLDSTVVGGLGAGGCFLGFAPSPTPCPCAGSGGGGAGVVAQAAFVSNSVVTGGQGGRVFIQLGPPPASTTWGQQPDGPAFVVGSLASFPPSYVSNVPRLGGSWNLAHRCVGLNALLLGFPSDQPFFVVGLGWVFMNLGMPITFSGFLPLCTTVPVSIPNDRFLLGLAIAAQQFDPLVGMGRPLFSTIQP